MYKEVEMIKPGFFGKAVAADRLRDPFDEYNEQLLMLGKHPDIVFLGDSITERWDTALYFADTGYYVENRGIGGDTTDIMLKRLPGDVLQLKPRYAVIAGGINDMMTTQDDLWWQKPGKNTAEVLSSICANIEEMARLCRNAGIEPVLTTVHICDLCAPFCNCKSEYVLGKENEFLKKLAAEKGYKLADYAACFMKDGKNIIRDYAVDGVHPDWAGYILMKEELLRALNG